MIIYRDSTNKNNSIYECDRCNKELTIENLYRIFIQKSEDKHPKRKWHFCKKCYIALNRGVEKGVIKRQGGTNE